MIEYTPYNKFNKKYRLPFFVKKKITFKEAGINRMDLNFSNFACSEAPEPSNTE